MDDRAAAEFYADPDNVRAGQNVTPSVKRGLGGHIPVRFPPEMVEQIKLVAQQDGVTVSTWIRRLVANELVRRAVPRSAAVYKVEWVQVHTPAKSPTKSGASHLVA